MERRRITDITIAFTPRQDLGDLDGLAASIRRWGLLQPVGVTADNMLVFGLRRLRACQLLGWETIPVVAVEDKK